MQIKNNNKNRGYTIIETMIAISIFLVVVMIGTNALLNANLIHRKSQDMRSIIDNLSFIMEDISRNLRTGYNYHCGSSGDFSVPLSCPSGDSTIAFESANGDPLDVVDQWVYRINIDKIEKSISDASNGNDFIQLNPDEVKIDAAASGFFVTGAEPSPGDIEQPYVTIKLVGNITYKPGTPNAVVTPFSLQTLVSQRLIDRQ